MADDRHGEVVKSFFFLQKLLESLSNYAESLLCWAPVECGILCADRMANSYLWYVVVSSSEVAICGVDVVVCNVLIVSQHIFVSLKSKHNNDDISSIVLHKIYKTFFFLNLFVVRIFYIGLSFVNKCPKGRSCNYLHVFRNPGNQFPLDLKRDTACVVELKKPIERIAQNQPCDK